MNLSIDPVSSVAGRILPIQPCEEKITKYAIEKIKASSTLVSIAKSLNHVFRLKEDGKTVAYLKISRAHEHGAVMEHFVWKMAELFGCDELFVPTGIIQLAKVVDQVFMVHRDVLKQNSPVCELKREQIVASAQFKEKGNLFKEYEGDLSQKQLLKTFLVAVLFGSYDWHSGNILIDQKGKIKLFDNTRAFPSSNRFHEVNHCFTPPFRLGLLAHPLSLKVLTEEETTFLKEQVKLFRACIPKFQSYVKGEEWQEKIKNLPEEWFHTEQVIRATIERINDLEWGLNQKSLVDIVCYVYPEYLFYTLLVCMKWGMQMNDFQLSKERFQYAMGAVGSVEIRSGIMYLCELGIDPELVYEKITDPQQSAWEVFQRVYSEIMSTIHSQRGRWAVFDAREGGVRLLNRIRKSASQEPKDYTFEDAHQSYRDFFFSEMNRHHIKLSSEPQEVAHNRFWIRVERLEGYGKYTLFYKSFTGKVHEFQLDGASFPGYIRVGDEELLTFNEFSRFRRVDFYHPNCSEKEARELLEIEEDGWLMIKGKGEGEFRVLSPDEVVTYKVIENNGKEEFRDKKGNTLSFKKLRKFWISKGYYPITTQT